MHIIPVCISSEFNGSYRSPAEPCMEVGSGQSMKAVENRCLMSPLTDAPPDGHSLKERGGSFSLHRAGAVAGEGAPGSAHCQGDFRPCSYQLPALC